MAFLSPPYRKIPGRGLTMLSHVWLYDAPEYMLLVTRTVWVENYRRFFYRDVQSLSLAPTRAFVTLNIIEGVFFVLGLSLLAGEGLGLRITAITLVSVFGLAWLGNLVLGPTCEVWIQTPSGRQRLRALSRIRTARKAISFLLGRIAEIQGTELPALPPPPPAGTETSTPAVVVPAIDSDVDSEMLAPQQLRRTSLAFSILGGVLWLLSVVSALMLMWPGTGLLLVVLLPATLVLGLAILAVVWAPRAIPAARVWAWSLLAFYVFVGMTAYVWFIAISVQQTAGGAVQLWGQFTSTLSSSPFLVTLFTGVSLVSFIFGITGRRYASSLRALAARIQHRVPAPPPLIPPEESAKRAATTSQELRPDASDRMEQTP